MAFLRFQMIFLGPLFFLGCQEFENKEIEALRISVDDRIAEVNELSKSIKSQVKDLKEDTDTLRSPSQVSILSSLFFGRSKKKVEQMHEKLTALEEDLSKHKEKKSDLEKKVTTSHKSFKSVYSQDFQKASYDKDKICDDMEEVLDELKEVERDYKNLNNLDFDFSSLLKLVFRGVNFFEISRIEGLRYRYEDTLNFCDEGLLSL